ncbi:hypothetical protein OC846_003652 [Tilletia horrida]|uniref:Peptidase M20 dimerisation domain-containing protein n=1 Tax=Tilletia horrida TaxID=155126 RepID=A0AAN6GUG6_9BASI|nr:hypothetical protein OC845_004292 [Tilletia horrida]KAK0550455.1 hypothetical protein OC846_003652 [Tilletia horrida]KAK0564113.1 hypothetical protein OC861_004464 [Tilletia horrida]
MDESHSHPHSQHIHNHPHSVPHLFHSLSHHGSSVLAIAVDESANIAYTASQSECIVVWDLQILQERTRLTGHTAAVLALELALDKGWLFSSSGDNTVRIWNIHTLTPVAVLYPAEDNVGDIFSLQWSQQLLTLYVGCQNTSIQWINLESVPASASAAALPIPPKPHKFFDSVPVALKRRRQREEAHSMYAASSSSGSHAGGNTSGNTTRSTVTHATGTPVPAARPFPLNGHQSREAGFEHGPPSYLSTSFSPETTLPQAPGDETEGQQTDRDEDEDSDDGEDNVVHLQFSGHCIVPFAHSGYVYALLLFYPDDVATVPNPWDSDGEASQRQQQHSNAPGSDSYDAPPPTRPTYLPILASASGDGSIKLWNTYPDGSLSLRATLQQNSDSEDGGSRTGGDEEDPGGILTLAHRPNTLLAGTQAGTIEIWDLETLTTVRTLRAHADDVLSLSTSAHHYSAGSGNSTGPVADEDVYVCFSSGADGEVRRWDGQFACTASWKAHDGLALACVPLRSAIGGGPTGGISRIITGGSDNQVKVWDLPILTSPPGSVLGVGVSGGVGGSAGSLVGSPINANVHGFFGPSSFGASGAATGSGPGNSFGATATTTPHFLKRRESSNSILGLAHQFSYSNLRASLSTIRSSPVHSLLHPTHHGIGGAGAFSEPPDVLLSALARFIAFRTVSSDEAWREESRQCAHWLKGCLTQLGAETMLLPGASRRNPLVLATFRGREPLASSQSSAGEGGIKRKKKRCLFYGHYDVVDDESGTIAADGNGGGSHHDHHGHSHPSRTPGSSSRPSTGSGLPKGYSTFSGANVALSPGLPSSSSGSFGSAFRTSGGHSADPYSTPGTPSSSSNYNTNFVGTQPPLSPWVLTGRDGYLYGRGASDNKGPILAVACAAAELLAKKELEMDVVLLIEGEEEVGSCGLKEAVRKAAGHIGDIDVILLSNSYWVGEETPCITMGLRGVIHATIELCGPERDVHSGVEGGAWREPMIDMVRLLSSLSDGDQVLIPHFYDAVRPVSDEDRAAFAAIAKMERRGEASQQPQGCGSGSSYNETSAATVKGSSTQTSIETLIARWCRPSLSIHRVGVSGSGNATVIPRKVEAAVSIRIVPDMDAQSVGEAFEAHVAAQFAKIVGAGKAGVNSCSVRIDHRADWWLGVEGATYSAALADAIEAEWGEAPVSIREGGSIPAIALLEKELSAPAVHLPMGQSSDNAHLPGERIRYVNLQRGRAVVRRFLESLPSL